MHTDNIRDRVQSPPLAAGLQINDAGARCTSAFVSNDEFSGQWYLLTAGHCSPPGGTFWYQGITDHSVVGNPVGGDTRNAYYRKGRDGIAIFMNALNVTNDIYIEGNYRGVTGVQRTDYVGDFVCKSGITSEQTCGQITDTNATINYGEGSDVVRQRVANLYSAPGDSGAPIYYFSTAKGVLSGGPANDFSVTYYSQITNVENTVDVNVLTR